MSTPLHSPAAPAPIEAASADRPRLPLRELARELFEEEGLNTVFTNARNAITGTMIVAAGILASHHPIQGPSITTWSVHFAGYAVVLIGALLLVLNLLDGLRSLAKRPCPMAVRVLLVLVYVGLSVRLVQVFMLFRLAA